MFDNVHDEDDKEIDMLADAVDASDNKVNSVGIWAIMKWNQTEWPYILIGSLCSFVMGAAMPLFAIVFGEVVGILSHPDHEYVRSQTNMFSLWFVIIGIGVGTATFFQVFNLK